MANTTQTPYMLLSLPIVGTEVGPAWASEINQALTTIDSHTHITGQGQPIPTAGINVNADFAFNNYNATNFRSVRLGSQNAALALSSDRLCLYATGGNLYFNDGSGNQIQMTLAGNVNSSGSGNITGMGATTATATYTAATSTFAFNSNTNTPAKFACGPLTIGRNVANPFTVTLTPNAAQASSYGLTLPLAIPASLQSAMVSDTSGNLSFLAMNSGSYTPTYTRTGDSFTVGVHYWFLIGNMVYVIGFASNAGGGGTNTTTISLPIAPSAFSSGNPRGECHGLCLLDNGSVINIEGTPTGTTAFINSIGNIANGCRIDFAYRLS